MSAGSNLQTRLRVASGALLGLFWVFMPVHCAHDSKLRLNELYDGQICEHPLSSSGNDVCEKGKCISMTLICDEFHGCAHILAVDTKAMQTPGFSLGGCHWVFVS